MTLEVGRRWVNGRWTTDIENETSGGGGSLPAGGTTGEVLTKVSDADGDADWQASGGGALASLKVVRFPIAFDTPGLVPTSYAITAFDEPTETITGAGDRTAAFADGVSVVIINDGAGNTGGSVVSAAFAAGETVVTLGGGSLPAEATPLTAVVAVGVTIYTPAVGDMLLGDDTKPITLVTVSEAWDGTSPGLRVLTEAMRQAQFTPFVSLDATVADDPQGVSLVLSASPGLGVGTHWRLWRFTTADPIIVTVDNSGLDAESTQGAAEIVLMVIPAA